MLNESLHDDLHDLDAAVPPPAPPPLAAEKEKTEIEEESEPDAESSSVDNIIPPPLKDGLAAASLKLNNLWKWGKRSVQEVADSEQGQAMRASISEKKQKFDDSDLGKSVNEGVSKMSAQAVVVGGQLADGALFVGDKIVEGGAMCHEKVKNIDMEEIKASISKTKEEVVEGMSKLAKPQTQP